MNGPTKITGKAVDVSSATKIGIALLGVNLVTLGSIMWASMALPDQWGGPNIGGGLFTLVALTGAAVGGYLIVTGRDNNSPPG